MKKNIFKSVGVLSLALITNIVCAQTETYHTWDYIPEDGIETVSSEGYAKSTACSNTSEGTIGLADCADIGTAAFGTAGITTAFDAEAGSNSVGVTECGNDNNGSWHVFDLDAGVEQVIVDYAGGFTGAGGFSDMHMGFYQGPNCASLTEIDCGLIIEKVGPNLNLYALSISGLDDSQQLWVYTHASKNFTIDFTLTGTGAAPANEDCASASTDATGCNLGASGAAFTPPTAAGQVCNGGNWSSNENTVFYSFTATATSGSIEIDNLICNDGTAGNAQIGVWTTCGGVGTYGASFLGCAVGTGSVALPTLAIGSTYIIAVDGFAGDACTWDFTTAGIILSVELNAIEISNSYNENVIEWSTLSETNNDYFIVERLIEEDTWEEIDRIIGSGTTSNVSKYISKDKNYDYKLNYYRLTQVNYDGNARTVETVYIDNSDDATRLVKIVNFMGAEVNESYQGPKIYVYKDGSTFKRY